MGDLKDLKAKIEKLAEQAASKAMEKVVVQIEQDAYLAYDMIINDFYNDYNPRSYRRGYNLFSGKETYSTSNGTNGKATIIISPDYMGDCYEDSNGTGYVFDGAYMHGFHGTSQQLIMSPTPHELMERWDKEYRNGLMKTRVQEIVDSEMKKIFG